MIYWEFTLHFEKALDKRNLSKELMISLISSETSSFRLDLIADSTMIELSKCKVNIWCIVDLTLFKLTYFTF